MRVVLVLVLLAGIGSTCLFAAAADTKSRPKAPFKLLFNNDTTNILSNVSPWHEEGQPFEERMLVASIEETAGLGVDAHMLSPGLGWVPWWQSKVHNKWYGGDHYSWWMAKTGQKPRGFDAYVHEGGDMVRVLVDTCRKHGMAPFVSLRLNDVHHQEFYNTKHPRSYVSCRFYCEHPEYLLQPDHPQKRPKGYYSMRGQNWAIPEVRAYKLALVTELCENYDLAGLELDFLRDHHMFRLSETTEAQRVEAITGFVRKVREALDRTTPAGKRRYLCARIPQALAAHGATGLDVRRLYEAGVDMFNLSGWCHTAQRSDAAEIRRLVPDAALYWEMTQSAGSSAYFIPRSSSGYGTGGNPRTSAHQLYTTAHLAHRRGCDGISLFNFVYYRMGHREDVPVMEPPFHALPKLNDVAWLGRQTQDYWLGACMYLRQIPRKLTAGKAHTFQFDVAPPPRPRSKTARLRLHTEHPLTDAHEIAVTMNGRKLKATANTTRFAGNPFDRMISPTNHRRAWLCPVDLLTDGLNDVAVTLVRGPTVNVIWLDLGIR